LREFRSGDKAATGGRDALTGFVTDKARGDPPSDAITA
tara:strand:- start:44372 stop:44485 length:114 start_codon:yes stop_codon:yes gene_type:complete